MDKKPKSARKGDLLTKSRPRWTSDIDENSYIIAFQYLSLLMDEAVAHTLVEQLRDQKIVTRAAKDLLRAVESPVPDRSDDCVTRELVAITLKAHLSPALYLRGNPSRKPIIAEGYHRICAAYLCDPDTDVPVKMI